MKNKSDKKPVLTQLGHHAHKYTAVEATVIGGLSNAFDQSPVPLAQRLRDFPRHIRRQDVARFLTKYELFKLNLPVGGSVVECGVFAGGGLFSWMHFSSVLEPCNHTRRVIGFDTFSGFPGVDEHDTRHGCSDHLREGAFRVCDGILQDIQRLTAIHDSNRPIGHIPKIELVVGNACETIPKYVSEHPHLLISLLYLDFDIYLPTKAALEHLYPRVVKGGIVAFDELNCQEFPGETMALIDAVGLEKAELKRFPLDPYITYFSKP